MLRYDDAGLEGKIHQQPPPSSVYACTLSLVTLVNDPGIGRRRKIKLFPDTFSFLTMKAKVTRAHTILVSPLRFE
jgi:hypothetical protein